MPLDEAYREFVASQPEATLWHDADFLECFGREFQSGRWKYASHTHGGELVGVLPYFTRGRMGGRVLTVPLMLRYCPPLLAQGEFDHSWAVGAMLTDASAGTVSVDQMWSPNEWDYAQQLGEQFTVSEHLTYFADTTGEPGDILSRASKSMRRRLRRAGEFFSEECGPLQERDLLMLRTPFREMRRLPYHEPAIARVCELLQDSNRVGCQRVFGPDGTHAASAVYLRDRHRMYTWLIGSRTDLANPNAGSYAYYRILLRANAAGVGEVDFLGSMLAGPAENRRQLGARPRPYPYIHSDNRWWSRMLRAYRKRRSG